MSSIKEAGAGAGRALWQQLIRDQPRQNASSQVLLSRMAEMIKPTIE